MHKLRAAVLVAALCVAVRLSAGGEHSGRVTVGDVPVPGVTVTATSGDKKLLAITDEQGLFQLPDATVGVWTLRVEMLGFEPLSREITVTAEPQPSAWALTLRPFEDLTRGIPIPRTVPATQAAPPAGGASSRAAAAAAPVAQGRGGFQRAGVTATPPPSTRRPAGLPEDPSPPESGIGAADGLLVNGSVNNGAASSFAQAAAFGNNRRGRGSLYNYNVAIVEGNSAFDARPFSLNGQQLAKADYNDFHAAGTFGGPLRFKHFMQNILN